MRLKITMLRHGQADKALSDHRLHPLSAEGRRQATDRRASLVDPRFDLVLHSRLRRTEETARLVAGLDENAETIVVPELFYEEDDPRGKALNAAFEKLGHASLLKYYEVVGNEMRSLAEEARIALAKVMESRKATNVLVIGHGMLLQAICTAITGLERLFMGRVLGECEGCVLIMEDDIAVVKFL